MTYDDFFFYGKFAGAIVSGCGALGLIWRYPICGGYSIYEKFKKILAIAENVESIVRKELTTNGGSSLKDCVKRIENKVAAVNGKVKAILDLDDLPVWESDEKGHCVWANHSYLKMTGFDFEYIKNAGWISIICESDRARVREEWTRAVEEQRIFSSEYFINRRDGTKVKVLGYSYPIVSIIDSSITGYVGRLSFVESK